MLGTGLLKLIVQDGVNPTLAGGSSVGATGPASADGSVAGSGRVSLLGVAEAGGTVVAGTVVVVTKLVVVAGVEAVDLRMVVAVRFGPVEAVLPPAHAVSANMPSMSIESWQRFMVLHDG